MKLLVVLVLLAALAALVVAAGAARSRQPQEKIMVTASDATTARGPRYSKSGYDVTTLSPERIDELAQKLSPADAAVILAKGTEPPFCGNLLDNHKDGVYVCKFCGLPLFSSDAKFDSGTGWPSFFQPFDRDHIAYHRDTAHGMVRTEILCARCGAHLGHVFEDGPRPTGLRYCLNSIALTFVEKGQPLPAESRPVQTATAYFAGGCFWGVEDRFHQVPGVIDAISGYMGGTTKTPTYQDVLSRTTGHAETVEVIYDPARVSYRQLLEWFFKFHDPTQLNRQGPDIGDNYRSAIFAATPEQAAEARAFIAEQQASPRFQSRTIVTQVVGPSDGATFWKAEEYHQNYHAKHGGSCAMPSE